MNQKAEGLDALVGKESFTATDGWFSQEIILSTNLFMVNKKMLMYKQQRHGLRKYGQRSLQNIHQEIFTMLIKQGSSTVYYPKILYCSNMKTRKVARL